MKEVAIPESLGGESFEAEAREGWLSWVATVDHKKIGLMYLFSALIFFLVAGVLALVMRIQLAIPENHFLSPETYNQIFTMHGTTMIFLVVVPALVGFANYLVPLMIGARDMAFPRLNALGFWVQALGGVMLYFSFATGGVNGGAPAIGWFGYAPLSETAFSYGPGVDYWVLGLLGIGVGTLTAGINLIATTICLRAPGMSIRRLPLFVWMTLVTGFLIVVVMPILNAGTRNAAYRPPAQRAFFPGRYRWLSGAVAACLLGLRPSRGLHHGAAGFRNDLRDRAGFLRQANLWL